MTEESAVLAAVICGTIGLVSGIVGTVFAIAAIRMNREVWPRLLRLTRIEEQRLTVGEFRRQMDLPPEDSHAPTTLPPAA